jgi:hypothetical protein
MPCNDIDRGEGAKAGCRAGGGKGNLPNLKISGLKIPGASPLQFNLPKKSLSKPTQALKLYVSIQNLRFRVFSPNS